ncbi:MAG: hypothetical protein L0Z68_00815 [Gammaproteobacteria bacterium]|nr:hypothetical protein [Gammaproteobacteria bacterium]
MVATVEPVVFQDALGYKAAAAGRKPVVVESPEVPWGAAATSKADPRVVRPKALTNGAMENDPACMSDGCRTEQSEEDEGARYSYGFRCHANSSWFVCLLI